MKGRKPKLFAVGEKDGDTGHRRRRNPPVAGGDFDPPFLLSDVAMQEWTRLRADAPWISAGSAGLLAMRCATYSDWVAIRAELAATKEPDWRLHQRERDAKAYIIRADVELGLTSCSQQKVSAPAAPALDALEDKIG